MPYHRSRRRGSSLPLLLAALTVCVIALLAPVLGRDGTAASPGQSGPLSPPVSASPAPPSVEISEPSIAVPTPADSPSLAPVSTPAPVETPEQASKAPDPSSEPVDLSGLEANRTVDMSYFSDALFIGDSRTEGLQMYSGIEGATFFCYKGISIFDVISTKPKEVVTLDGKKYSVVDALDHTAGQFGKVYISLGVNELGYYDDQGYHDKFCALIDKVRETQPDAIIYLQNVVPVNPELCAKYWPSYVTNDKVDTYNEILSQVAEEKAVILLDLHTALGTSDGILAKENTSDGVHFNKAWYKEWLNYLMTHAV